MIQKIRNTEYLKPLGNMNAVETQEYLNRVGEWLDSQSSLLTAKYTDSMASFQNVLQCAIMWNDAETKAWSDGVILLTALASVCDTWLPDRIYAVAAKRSIKQLVRCLSNASVPKGNSEEDGNVEKAADIIPVKGNDDKAPAAAVKDNKKATQTASLKPLGGEAVPVVRPKHIDQYIHLLPKETQERAATVRGLLRELDVARENMRLLSDVPTSPSDKLAQWAKMATKLDEKIKSIYKEIDREWDNLVKKGIVKVDDFGNAFVVKPEAAQEDATEKKNEEEKPAAEETTEEITGKEAPPAEEHPKKMGRPALTDEQKAAKKAEREEKKHQENVRKAGLLRKSLIDKRNAPTEEQKEKWVEKFKEMVKLGGEASVTDKVREVASSYGIDITKL